MKYIFLLSLLIGSSISYNAGKAIDYARKYCKKYNSNYKKYPNADCANFVSQCLIAGGENLSKCGGKDAKGAIPYVPNLRSCLEKLGWRSSVGVNKKFKAGYPFFEGKNHAMIATGVNGNKITYYGHTNDRCDYSLVNNNYIYYYK